MDYALAAIIISLLAVVANVFGGGWRTAGRLSAIETNVVGIQEEVKKLGDVMVKLADMRGDHRVLEGRMASVEQRMTMNEQMVDDLRRGRGKIN